MTLVVLVFAIVYFAVGVVQRLRSRRLTQTERALTWADLVAVAVALAAVFIGRD